MLIGASTLAQAQNAPQATATADGGLEQIVVTATRREESIRDVPISISAFSQEQMDIQGVRGIDDIARLTPGVQFTRGGGNGSDLATNVSIRGISSPAGQSTTGIYIDDTPIQVGATVASGNFVDNAYPQLFDVQRVEVLRGPQGTLFGSGSEGGTIRFITPPPNLTSSSAYVRSEVATTEYGAPSYEVGAAGGAPLIQDKLGFRASVWTRHNGGYVDAVDYYTGKTTNPNSNYSDMISARFALGWQPLENLTVTPSVFTQTIKANGTSQFFLRSDGVTGSVTPGGPPLPPFQQPYGDVTNGEYVDLHQTPQFGNQRLTLPALKVDYHFAKMELLSNTSYYDRREHVQTDYGFIESGIYAGKNFINPAWDVIGSQYQGNHFFTQEVRLQSDDAESRLQWVTGVFYSHTNTYGNTSAQNPHLGDMLAAGPLANGCTPAQCFANRFSQPLVDGIYAFIGNTSVKESQKALFGQADYRLTDHFTATVGLRYAKLTNSFINTAGGATNGVPFPTYKRGSAASSALTPKYMLSYKTGNGSLYYASATKGFRNGGSNAPVANPACAPSLAQLGLKEIPLTFDPDNVWSYELGTKFTTDRGRLQIDASVFQVNWTHQIQNISLPTCIFSFTTNIGKTQSRGFDLAIQWRALDPLVLSLNGGYQYVKAIETISPGGRNFITNGDALPGSQPSLNAAAQYSFNVLDRPAYFRVDFNYTGQTARGANFNPQDASYPSSTDPSLLLFRNPSTRLTNVRLGSQLGAWDVSLFCNNLFNSQPILNENRATLTFSAVPSGMLTAYTLRPRTAGVTAVMRF